jgi:hypothetical protein
MGSVLVIRVTTLWKVLGAVLAMSLLVAALVLAVRPQLSGAAPPAAGRSVPLESTVVPVAAAALAGAGALAALQACSPLRTVPVLSPAAGQRSPPPAPRKVKRDPAAASSWEVPDTVMEISSGEDVPPPPQRRPSTGAVVFVTNNLLDKHIKSVRGVGGRYHGAHACGHLKGHKFRSIPLTRAKSLGFSPCSACSGG